MYVKDVEGQLQAAAEIFELDVAEQAHVSGGPEENNDPGH